VRRLVPEEDWDETASKVLPSSYEPVHQIWNTFKK
jgi:hypothetical protein